MMLRCTYEDKAKELVANTEWLEELGLDANHIEVVENLSAGTLHLLVETDFDYLKRITLQDKLSTQLNYPVLLYTTATLEAQKEALLISEIIRKPLSSYQAPLENSTTDVAPARNFR